jgi:putative PIN family toxin of toxin-antitoxin system
MKRVVIDTNVIISTTISPNGNPAQIMNLVSYMELQLFYSSEILDEYSKVLAYKKLKIPTKTQIKVIESIKKLGTMIVPTTSAIPLPDESDRIFYDTARESGAILITGNIKHYPEEPFIMTPAEFMRKLGEQ